MMQLLDPTPESTASQSWKVKTGLFLISQNISLFGSSLVQFAIIWYITLQTQSGSMMMISTLVSFLPQILISMPAGVWADRYNRKWLIMAADSAIALSTVGLIIAFILGYKALWLIFAVQAIRSVGTGIQSPAVNALLPQLVPEEHLMRVNGLNGTLQSVMFLVSPIVSGLLYGTVGLVATFCVDVVTAAIAVAIMSFLKGTAHKRAQSAVETSHLEDFKEGFNYIMGHSFLKNLFAFYALFMFFIVPAAMLSPLMVARTFGPEVWKLTANEVMFSVGTLVGGIVITVWGGFKNKIYTISISSVMFGITTIGMGLAPTLWIYLGIIFVTGLFIPFFNSASMVLFQKHVEENMMGRVFSINSIISGGAFPLGMMVFGPLADQWSVQTLMVLSGFVLTMLGILIYYNRALKEDEIDDIT